MSAFVFVQICVDRHALNVCSYAHESLQSHTCLQSHKQQLKDCMDNPDHNPDYNYVIIQIQVACDMLAYWLSNVRFPSYQNRPNVGSSQSG